jgi:hypothetical protein
MKSPTITWALIRPATSKCPCNLRLAHGLITFLTLNQTVPHSTTYEVNFNRSTQPSDLIFFPFDIDSPALVDWLNWLHLEYDPEMDDDYIIRIVVVPTSSRN